MVAPDASPDSTYPSLTSLPRVGTIFCGKYEIAHPLGTGGMGVVLAARHLRLDQPVALKFLRDEQLKDVGARLRFEREARAAARLTSANAVRILDVDSTPDGVPFIVMEILNGYDLSSRLKAHQQLPYAEVVDWILQACHAVAEAHAVGIVHRDLKPSNLFMAEAAMGEPIVKVLDFGISKILDSVEPELTSTDMTLGTPHYMSPEQVGVGKVVDGRTDTWALSVILYRAISGAYPFHAPSPTQIAVAIATTEAAPIESHGGPPMPPELAKAIMRGLEKDPVRRYQDAHSLAEAIVPFGTGRIVPPSRLSKPRTDPLRKPRVAAAPPSGPSLTVDEQSAPTISLTKNLTSIEIPFEIGPAPAPSASSSSRKWLFAIPAALGVIGLVLAAMALKHPAPPARVVAAPPITTEIPAAKPTETGTAPSAEAVAPPVVSPASSASAKTHGLPLAPPTKKTPPKPSSTPKEDPVHL